MPATLPHPLQSNCLHAPPPLGSPLAKPPPLATAPRTTASARSTQHHQRTAGGRKHPLTAQLRRCTKRTSEVQRCQLRHPSEARCQRRYPSCSDPIVCTHPREIPQIATAPRTTAPAHSTQCNPCTAGVCMHPLTAQLAADARSVPLRTSDVSCAILPRLGASDAAPSSRISLTARTAAPRLAPRKPPPLATAPRATASARSIISAQPAAASTRSQHSWPPMHEAYH